MQEWIQNTLETPSLSPTVLFAALLLGLIGCVTNICNLPLIGAVAGYSGSMTKKPDKKDILISGLSFMLGTIIALGILGALTGFISQTIGSRIGSYWKYFAGFILIFFGMGTLNILPFKLPQLSSVKKEMPSGTFNAMFYGLAIGGGTAACSVGCNPVLPVALGVTALQGNAAWGAVILGVFAIGYSLPIAVGLMGMSLGVGKLTSVASKAEPVIKIVAGVLLLTVGFYFLATA